MLRICCPLAESVFWADVDDTCCAIDFIGVVVVAWFEATITRCGINAPPGPFGAALFSTIGAPAMPTVFTICWRTSTCLVPVAPAFSTFWPGAALTSVFVGVDPGAGLFAARITVFAWPDAMATLAWPDVSTCNLPSGIWISCWPGLRPRTLTLPSGPRMIWTFWAVLLGVWPPVADAFPASAAAATGFRTGAGMFCCMIFVVPSGFFTTILR